MSKIDISIWGIRAGFEDSGIFHSHNFIDVKELQKDKFRALADLSRPGNAYMVNRTSNHTIVSIIHTDIFEVVSDSRDPRSGYIVISLIFDKNKALSVSSPRDFLQQFVQWYKKVQGNARVNNFTAEQIQAITNQLSLVECNLRDVPGKKAIPFKIEDELDTYLTGGSKYIPFSETLFYDVNVNFEQSGLKNELIPMATVIDIGEQEEEKRRKEEEQYKLKQFQIAEKERELLELKTLGRLDLMVEAFDKFQYNHLLKASLRNEIETEKQKRAELIQSQEEQRKAEEISRLIQDKNLDLAFAKFEPFREKSRLSAQEQRMMQVYKDDLRSKNIKDQKERELAEGKVRTRKAIKIALLVGVPALLVVLSVLSFMLEMPLSLYDKDSDLVANSIDSCPEVEGEKKYMGCPDTDKDGVEDSKDECIDEPGTLNGCPDTDDDGLSVKDEKEKGTDPKKEDTDGDGVNDKSDKCPNEKGKKENNGCKEKVPDVIPIPPINDVNTIVTISYKGVQYTIKKGFTTVEGMSFNSSGWRYYNNKWENEAKLGSGQWKAAKTKDINFVLSQNATKIVSPPGPKTEKTDTDGDGITDELEKANRTDPKKKDTDGDKVNDNIDECPLVKGTKPNGCLESNTITSGNKQKLSVLFSEISNGNFISKANQKKWQDLYSKLSTAEKQDKDIKYWDREIADMSVE